MEQGEYREVPLDTIQFMKQDSWEKIKMSNQTIQTSLKLWLKSENLPFQHQEQ